ncbi:Isoprenylcysteine carboxyl methyltransferase [Burkholderiales bacterium]
MSELRGSPLDLPASAVSHGCGWVGFAGMVAGAVWLASGSSLTLLDKCLAMLGSAILPMVVYSLLVDRVHQSPSTGLHWAQPRPWSEVWRTTRVKWLGWAAVVVSLSAVYFAVRTYRAGSFALYFEFFERFGPWLVPASLAYLAWVDRYMAKPQDGYWHAGLAVLGRWSEVHRPTLQDFALSWAVKGFFLAFMASILPGAVHSFTDPGTWSNLAGHASVVFSFGWVQETSGVAQRLLPLVAAVISAVFFVDILFGALGYIMTFRPLDTHIRSAHPTLLGWVAALSCYPPFTIMGNGMALDYRQTPEWFFWFAQWPWVSLAWAACIVLLAAIYAWSTMVFGMRFSNLTHRGILTHGPYAVTKHPAYLTKVLFWWMVHMPFLNPNSGWEALRNTLLLAFISWVYWLRAKTEERHLRLDPTYVAYEQAMAQRHARWFGRRHPILT